MVRSCMVSRLVSQSQIPPGLTPAHPTRVQHHHNTPVTYRRVDHFFEPKDLEELHRKIHPMTCSDFSLLSDEETYDLNPNEYMPYS